MTAAGVAPALRPVIVAVIAVLIGVSASGCAPSAEQAAPTTVRIPEDAATISEALASVAPGGLVLVGPGTYRESVTVDTADVTVRGTDRSSVVIDGEGLRSNGIQVIADGVRIQNLTVVNHTFNGVLVTGMHDATGAQAHNLDGYTRLDPEEFPPLQRFEVSNVTASNNGLYGIYSFNAQHGVIRDNYASGSADSGFYVGQCADCDILVTGNVAEHNAIGYENANASDSVVIAGNRFSDNRVGLTLLSWYQEAYLPQRSAQVVGNLIVDNNSPESPAQALGAFGIGVGLSGANDNVLTRNRIAGNSVSGLQLTNTEDLASVGTRLVDNVFEANGVDVADVSAPRAPSADTCVTGGTAATFAPRALAEACGAASSAPAASGEVPSVTVPPGMSFLRVKAGPPQPSLPGDVSVVPRRLPSTAPQVDLDSLDVPTREFLADRVSG